MTRTTPEPEPPLRTFTPHQHEDVCFTRPDLTVIRRTHSESLVGGKGSQTHDPETEISPPQPCFRQKRSREKKSSKNPGINHMDAEMQFH
ncbi:hypothetical protein AVEN_253711-1 [Araneus ventricosus]|uniref:Uncharacterized protein n=1 Tax=Araneus ventricosus TaxID=182803 RepID=A0A4Y2DX29_ARAVE|nr:hypothetical protein AVEN_253711-1 [Araneus ventricosus]